MTTINSINTHRHRPLPPALRLASRIHQQITRRHQLNASNVLYPLDQLTSRLEQLAALRRHLEISQQKGWHYAQAQMLTDLQYLLRSIPGELRAIEQAMPQATEILSIAELAREFEQIDDEFGGWGYEAPGILLVATEPITLEEISLGVFEIRLNLENLGRHSRSHSPYEVVARQPNPATCNDAVTHPHVRDNELCEGDAAIPLRAALAEGRLCDFFMLVRSVLQTYNPHSPHVALDKWHGHPCHDCNDLMDDTSYCQACDHDFCESCISYCRCCDDTRCLNCLDECPQCDARTCTSCMDDCGACGKPCCRDCLEDGTCPSCIKKEEPSHKETSHDDNDSVRSPCESTCHSPEFGVPCSAGRENSFGGTRGGATTSIRARRRRRHRNSLQAA